MTVAAPPCPPRVDDAVDLETPEALEALIEEARRRARRRRSLYGLAGLLAAGSFSLFAAAHQGGGNGGGGPTPSTPIEPHGKAFSDGRELTYALPQSWFVEWDVGDELSLMKSDEPGASSPSETGIVVGSDPRPPGSAAPDPPSARTLASAILANEELTTTDPVRVMVGGLRGTRLDAVATGAGTDLIWVHEYGTGWHEYGPGTDDKMRVYLLDVPKTSKRAGAFAVIIYARQDEFGRVLEEATQIVRSFRFDIGSE